MDFAEVTEDALREPRQILKSAMHHHGAGDLQKAEAEYLAVLELDYRIADILPLLAGLAAKRGDLVAAVERWTRLLDLVPAHFLGLVEKGSLLHRLGRWPEAVTCLEAAHAIEPRHVTALSNLAVALTDAGRQHEALMAFRRLARLQPGNVLVEHQIRRLSSAVVPFWHIPMLNDQARNEAFERAIVQAIARHGHDARVLDIGAGSGLLSMMAARAGARDIVCCESVGCIADLAHEIVAANGYADSIRVVAKKSDQLVIGEGEMAQRADILVSEVLSSDLLAEGVLATFEDALGRLVSETATVIPRRVTARGCLIASDVLAKYAFVGDVSGFDVSAFTRLAAQRLPVHGKRTAWTRMSNDYDLVSLDLTARRHDPATALLSLTVTADGVAVGVMQWMHIDLAEGISFENPPEDYCDGGWLQTVHTFPQPVRVRAGDRLDLVVGHDRTSLIVLPRKL